MPKRAYWEAYRKSIDTLAFESRLINDIVHPHRVAQGVVSDRDVCFTADYWRDVARILQTKLLMFTAFHPETDVLSDISNKTVSQYFSFFTTHNQGNWDDYLPLAEYANNSSVHHSTKQMPFELNLGDNPPLQLYLIPDLQQPEANESAKTIQGREFVERLHCILVVAGDELRDAQDEQTAEAIKSHHQIDTAITAGVNVFLDTNDLPITYANVNPVRRKLLHPCIGPYEIFRMRRNAVALDLPNDMTTHNTVNVSRLKVDRTDHSRVTWCPPPPPGQIRHTGTSHVVHPIANQRPSSDGTNWEYEVKWEGWDKKDNNWVLEENMAEQKKWWSSIGRK